MLTVLRIVKTWGLKKLDLIVLKAKKITLPFFDSIPLYDVALFFWKGIVDGAITTRASAIAFNFMLAVFPAIIFLFTLIPYIPIDNFQEELLKLIESIVPKNAYVAINGTIEDIITQPRGSLLSFGFLAAFIFSTNGLVSVIVAFNNTIHAIESRSLVSLYAIAFGLSIILTTLTTISVAMITASQRIMDFLKAQQIIRDDDFLYYMVIGGKWLVILLLFFFAFAFLFYYAPARKMRFRFISAGGTLATVLSILISVGFSFYINNFGKYNTLYGSIGTLVVVMLWFYFMALILLIGFELNVSIWSAQSHATRKQAIHILKEQEKLKTEL